MQNETKNYISETFNELKDAFDILAQQIFDLCETFSSFSNEMKNMSKRSSKYLNAFPKHSKKEYIFYTRPCVIKRTYRHQAR